MFSNMSLPFYFLILVKSYVFAFSSCLSLSDYSLHSLSAPFQLTNIHFQIVFWEKYWVKAHNTSMARSSQAAYWKMHKASKQMGWPVRWMEHWHFGSGFTVWVQPEAVSKMNLVVWFQVLLHKAIMHISVEVWLFTLLVSALKGGHFSSHAAWIFLGTWWRRFLHAAGWS